MSKFKPKYKWTVREEMPSRPRWRWVSKSNVPMIHMAKAINAKTEEARERYEIRIAPGEARDPVRTS